MNNLVDQLKVLSQACDTECVLRFATETEFNNGNQNGPMKQAHDQAIQHVLQAAQALINEACRS